jgi:hypothetical protein
LINLFDSEEVARIPSRFRVKALGGIRQQHERQNFALQSGAQFRFDQGAYAGRVANRVVNEAAEIEIHFDPWWNAAVEAQATDRAHRIGQKRVVTSYKLIARDTVEEKILALQKRKRELASAMLETEEPLMTGLTTEDLTELLAP